MEVILFCLFVIVYVQEESCLVCLELLTIGAMKIKSATRCLWRGGVAAVVVVLDSARRGITVLVCAPVELGALGACPCGRMKTTGATVVFGRFERGLAYATHARTRSGGSGEGAGGRATHARDGG